MAFSTELAYRCGLRAHELLTIERTSDKRADKRFYADGREKNLSSKFDGMGDGVRYVVTGKGGLTREIFVPKDLAIQLEQRRLPEPIRVRDRGVFYVQKGTVAKLAMRQPFVLFKGLTFQKLCLPGAFRPGDHHNKMLRPGLCVVHASPQYL